MREIFLKPWQEARGTLIAIEVSPEFALIILSFKVENVKIEIPLNELRSDVPDLKELVGNQVLTLRTDQSFIVKPTNGNERR